MTSSPISATGSFDGIAEGYDYIASRNRDRTAFFLANLSDRRNSALDVGCGSGILAADLAQFYDRVVGIDASGDMLAIARQKRALPNVEYLRMDANEISLDEPFDLIVSSTTFHHLTDVPRTLATLKGLLPGGRIVIVDCVLRRFIWLNRLASKHPWVHALSVVEFPALARRIGLRPALRATRFHLSKPWREHLASDRFLRPEEFEALYGESLPGATFANPQGFMAACWDAPQ